MAYRKRNILMLGWEFPPQITGGLGTACEGLTQALSNKNVRIHFLMPRLYGNESAPYLNLYDVRHSLQSNQVKHELNHKAVSAQFVTAQDLNSNEDDDLVFYEIPSFLSPYLRPEHKICKEQLAAINQFKSSSELSAFKLKSHDSRENLKETLSSLSSSQHHYGARLFEEVESYARRASILSYKIDFDIIHAHDWMTFPAAFRIKKKTGKPVVLHVHSLESDRSGDGGNEIIHKIEKNALRAADAVIAVSHYTKRKIMEHCGVPSERIFVVHNGITQRNRQKIKRRSSGQFNVLFLGRITFQKGPDYFVEAAIQVLKQLPQVQFILAGTGDMLGQLRARIIAAGVEKNFKLPGFLRGREVDEVFSQADLYVMPSVSEPFGISVLEALYHDVPVIVSRQTGVSEVIQHSLKTDFWDVEELADLMVGALKFPELRRDLLQMAKQEMNRLDWDVSATQVAQVYYGLV